jgi:cytochrome c
MLLAWGLAMVVGSTVAWGDEPAQPDFDANRLEVTELATQLNRPMELAVAPDGRVYFIELDGRLRRYDPKLQSVETIGEMTVTTEQENGLIGLALDPQFATNGWIYLQYSPPDYPGQHISRFTLIDGKLDLSTEKLIYKFEEQRKECCHHAGSLAFGPDGLLYIGTGDNTHPHGDSQGYAPIDQRPERAPWDAQKSAANSRSGSGKVLRIKPTPDGGYTVPAGNLFPPDGSQGLPEIYVMGCRNPWRISVDQQSGFLYWGDVGPDAAGEGPRGPRGFDEVNQARTAGFFGWPYFIADNRPYSQVDFAMGQVGDKFDAAKPINSSPNNTGLRELPPAQPALLYYPYGKSAEFPELGEGGRTACAGPVYHFDAALESPTKFPANFNRVLFIYEWTRHWIKAVHLNESGNVAKIEPFMPQHKFLRPIDMQFGPDGALYVLEYGETWGVNQDARLIRIDYMSGNRRPVAKALASNNVGRHPLEVTLSSEGTFDKDSGDTLSYQWRALRVGEEKNEPQVLSTEPNPKLVFDTPGVYNVELVITDSHGAQATASAQPVMVGNARPTVRFVDLHDGSFVDPDQPLAYAMYVRDFEDGTSDYDEADNQDIEFIDGDAHARLSLNVSPITGALFPSAERDSADSGPLGLRLMKGSDCFNCHYIDQKRVGPPLIEIADKYRNQSGALEASIKRVREGATGVWGKIPMIAHTQHTDDELREMVSWVYSLKRDGSVRVFQGFSGEIPHVNNAESRQAHLLLEATYTDRGAEGIPPQAESVAIKLRNRRCNATVADEIFGPQILQASDGAKFLGAINHGNFARFSRVPLDQTAGLVLRVASAGAGGKIEVRLDKPDGPLLGSAEVVSTGNWEEWYEQTVPLTDASGTHDLFLVFVHPGHSALMNLRDVYFQPRTEQVE